MTLIKTEIRKKMKKWYKAVCDECGEAIDLFVNNPSVTACYLSDKDRQIQRWMDVHDHENSDLRLIYRDDQMDKLWDDGWETTVEDELKIFKKVI